mgnify:FL=1
MACDFDVIVDRRCTDCVKWDGLGQRYGGKDLLPFWVADMDFAVAAPIQKAIMERVQHPVYGYTEVAPSVYEAITGWLERRHNWHVEPEWISYTTGVVNALNLIVWSYTLPGDKVIIQPPVYGPFFRSVLNNGRQVIHNDLVETAEGFVMDLDDLERKIDSRTKMLILCNPHNPVGRVWSKQELGRLAEICLKHDVLMVSDEIHSDFIYTGHKHLPLASLSPEIAEHTITCMAPSKTFNLAGLATSFVVISNQRLRELFGNTLENVGVSNALLGFTALEAAYRYGEEWLDELLVYLEGNRDFMRSFLEERIPSIKTSNLEGTYLAWLDCRDLAAEAQNLRDFFVEKAKIAVNDGLGFGPQGKGFIRFNIGCPRPMLREGLSRMERALKEQSGVSAALT